MNFITRLLLSNSFNTILDVVDQLSKIAYYISTITKYNSVNLARLFLDNIFHLHGLSDSIVTDYST